MNKLFLFSAACMMYIMQAQATVRTASVTGNWNSTTTWGGTVPVANDDVVINAGVTVTINVSPANITNVTVSGTLQWDATGTGRTWTVAGNFTVNAGGSFNCMAPGTATIHTLNYNGTSLTNNGTFNMVNSSNKCNVVVGNSVTQTIGGSSAITFNKFTLNNTGGKFQIVYSGGSFTPTEINPTKLNVGVTTSDSCVIKQGLLIGCSIANTTVSHSFANFKMGSGTTKITSSVSLGGDATITVNTAMILNDASNSNVSMTVTGSFISPSMSQSNAATAFGMQGPNCAGGASNSTTLSILSDWSMTDIFVFVGSTKLFGGTEPNNPTVTASGNISWLSSETHTIDLPFTSDDFYIKTCFFGLFDSQGAFPQMNLNGGSVSVPKTFNIAFDVFDAEVQESSPLGQETIAQISESMANWIINGNYKILSGASLAIHSDNTLTVFGSLRIASGGEVAGSETETDDSGYIPVNGPSLTMGIGGTLYVENSSGLGKGLLTEAASDVSFKNRTSDIDWNLSGANSSGTIEYAALASQPVTDRTYNNLSTSGSGTKTLSNSITVNGTTTIGTSTTLGNGGFNATLKGAVTNNGAHSGTGKMILGGTSNQSLSGTGSDWGNVEINNASGATCNSNLNTNATFTFTSGILTTSSSAKLILTNSGITSGGSSSSCVYGPIVKTTISTATVLFPLGNGGNFRPLSVTPSSTSATTWQSEYFFSPFNNITSVSAPITSVNSFSHWTCDRTFGSANANVTLQWNTTEGLTDLNGLTVARWDGTKWTDAGASLVTGTASSGTVKSNVVSAFSPFTLGEANTITTSSITGSPFCPEASVSVPFNSTGTFNGGNIYTAELSDKKGNFTAPTSIGTLSSTANSGTINATIASKPKAGTKYRIRVTSSGPVVTGTDNGTNLELIACDKVTGFSTSGITSTTATVNWNTVPCAAKYKVQYRKQGTSSWTSKFSTTGSYNITGLLANTTYEWRVQTYCTESGSSKSGFASIQTFTTALRLASEESLNEGMSMYPNPAADQVQLSIFSNENHSGTLKIFNALGQVMMEDVISMQEGSNLLSFNVASLLPGIYFVEVSTTSGNEKMIQKLVKE